MWYNPLVTWLLRSPLRWLMDRNTLLLTYTGRKSGRTYTFPISYAATHDGVRATTACACGRALAAGRRRQLQEL